MTGNRTVAIASGKGGVGKTFLTANISIALAELLGSGGSVVSIDLDLGCGNLNTCMGVRSPTGTISDFILGRTDTLSTTMSLTDVDNLRLISGAFDGLMETNLRNGWKPRLIDNIRTLDSDFTCLDLAAGVSDTVIDFFLAAEDRVVVITPESLSMHNAFLFVKAAMMRLIDRELANASHLSPVRQEVHEILQHEKNLDLKTLIERVKEWDVYAGYLVRGIIDELHLKFVINMYHGGEERKFIERFHNLLISRLYLRNFQYLGVVHFGKKVHDTAQSLKPFVLTYPRDLVSHDIHEVASILVNPVDELLPTLRLPR